MFNLFISHWRSIADLRNGRGGKPRWGVRALVFGPPILVGLASWWWAWNLSASASMLAGGFALVAGLLLSSFTQIASWRSRLDNRAAAGWMASEAPARRNVNAAATHALAGVVVAVLATVVAVIVSISVCPGRLLIAFFAATSTLVGTQLLLVVDTLYTGYLESTDKAVSDSDSELLEGQ